MKKFEVWSEMNEAKTRASFLRAHPSFYEIFSDIVHGGIWVSQASLKLNII